MAAVDPTNDRVYFLDSGIQGNPIYAFAISTGQSEGSLQTNLNLTDELPMQMEVLPSGELMILTNATIRIVPRSLLR
jgi:hypothetical protein